MISDARRGHVSPGIYTEEHDVTYSVKSLGITSLGLVGETLYGPAFENIEIKNWSEFVDYFGGTSPEKFKKSGLPKYGLPYIAKSYLEASQRLNVVRVLGLSGYHAGPFWGVKDTNGNVVVVLRSKMNYGSNSENICEPSTDNPQPEVSAVTIGKYEEEIFLAECIRNSGDTNTNASETSKNSGETWFQLVVTTRNNEVYKYNVTLDKNHSNYIYNVLSTSSDGNTPIYIEAIYESARTAPIDTTVSGICTSSEEKYDDYKEAYRAALTPWIVSEAAITKNGEERVATMKKLFRFVTISDGNAANTQIKVSIEKIDPEYGTFDVVVRDFYDTDSSPIVLERFNKCNLINGDAGCIAYRIGTSDGGFVAKSKYILVEMSDNEDINNSFPSGFLGYPMPDYNGDGKVLELNYNTLYYPELKAKRQYFGFSNLSGIDEDVFSYKGKYCYGVSGYTTYGFHMDSAIYDKEDSAKTGTIVYVDGVSGQIFTTVSHEKVGNETHTPRLINGEYIKHTIYDDIKTRKFTVCFFGGFDGWDVHRGERTNSDRYKSTKYNLSGSTVFSSTIEVNEDLNLPLNLPTTAITTDYYAYLAGYRMFANPQDIDINLFATPGINWYDNTLLTEEVIDIVEDAEEGRGGDALYIMESPTGYDSEDLSDLFNDTDINSSYACTYAPWVMYYDASNRRYLNLPVTKDVVRNMAATDNNSYPWFAPAGLERGNVNCVKAEFKTTLLDEDKLYERQINPVKSFAQDGVKIWGNKTAYKADSPINRINVRRLMIRVKKLITNASRNLIFTQYDDTLEKQFRGLIDPILAEVKSNRGISDYRIITEVTPETKDQHILPAKILIKPTPALEYISISFVVYPESVSFENE